MKLSRKGLMVAISGVIVGFSPILAPIHELGHVIVATLTGYTVVGVGWTVTYFAEQTHQIAWPVLMAGYISEAVVMLLVARAAAKRHTWWLAIFSLSYMIGVIPSAWFGADYALLMDKYGAGPWFLAIMANSTLVLWMIMNAAKAIETARAKRVVPKAPGSPSKRLVTPEDVQRKVAELRAKQGHIPTKVDVGALMRANRDSGPRTLYQYH